MLDVRLGIPQHHRHLTIYPLLSPNERDLPYILLIDAINTSLVEITEKGGGTVPTLNARNSATMRSSFSMANSSSAPSRTA